MSKLSSRLDEALAQLEYHRDQLIYWRKRQQELEQQIPRDKNILDLVKDFLDTKNANEDS